MPMRHCKDKNLLRKIVIDNTEWKLPEDESAVSGKIYRPALWSFHDGGNCPPKCAFKISGCGRTSFFVPRK